MGHSRTKRGQRRRSVERQEEDARRRIRASHADICTRIDRVMSDRELGQGRHVNAFLRQQHQPDVGTPCATAA